MKKVMVTALACAFSLCVSAQAKWGFKAGSCLSGYRSESELELNPEYKSQFGYRTGVFVSRPIAKSLSIQPELLFTQRRAKAESTQSLLLPSSTGSTLIEFKVSGKFLPFYLDLPVFLMGDLPIGKTKVLNVGLGPVVSYGIGGKLKVDTAIENVKISGEQKLFVNDEFIVTDPSGDQSVEEIGGEAILKRFDFGVAATIGWHIYPKLIVSVDAQYGLINISNDESEKLFTRSLSLNLGYEF